MPAELPYYVVWYILSRGVLVGMLHVVLRENAKEGHYRLFGADKPLLLGFIPVLPDVFALLVLLAFFLSQGFDLLLEGIADFYRNRYGERRE